MKLETGADLAALPELDQRLWTVLSASTKGLRFDAATLRLLDADGDGRIRAPDVLAAVAWLRPRFRSLDVLFARKAEVSLADVDATTEEGKTLLASFTRILAREDRADATAISLADVLGATALFNAQPFNGDGVITPKSTADAALANLSLVGSILIFAVGINLVFGKKIKVADFLPALIVAALWQW